MYIKWIQDLLYTEYCNYLDINEKSPDCFFFQLALGKKKHWTNFTLPPPQMMPSKTTLTKQSIASGLLI